MLSEIGFHHKKSTFVKGQVKKNPDSSPVTKKLGEERPGLHCKKY